MIVVDDDSPDGTSDLAFALASADCRMRCLRRVNRNGLAGAVVEGWMSSSADLVAVIDGDLQHDETSFPALGGGQGNVWNYGVSTNLIWRRAIAAERGCRPEAVGVGLDRWMLSVLKVGGPPRAISRRPDCLWRASRGEPRVRFAL
jgi:glycosyltransferase involved in cell wall biosynthesis